MFYTPNVSIKPVIYHYWSYYLLKCFTIAFMYMFISYISVCIHMCLYLYKKKTKKKIDNICAGAKWPNHIDAESTTTLCVSITNDNNSNNKKNNKFIVRILNKSMLNDEPITYAYLNRLDVLINGSNKTGKTNKYLTEKSPLITKAGIEHI